MAEVRARDHAPLPKTPQQLIAVVLLALLIPIIGIVLIAKFTTGGLKVDSRSPDASEAAVAERLKPVASVMIGEVPAPAAQTPVATATPAAKSASGGSVAMAGGTGAGKKLYDTACTVCHATGIAGAPKTGDKAAWKPRIAAGKDALYNSALKGKNAMPAKGGQASAPDADVKAAVDYMVSQTK